MKTKKVYSRRPEIRAILTRCPKCGTQRSTDVKLKNPTCGDCWLFRRETALLIPCNRELRPASDSVDLPADIAIYPIHRRG